jgi:hypothetical protein
MASISKTEAARHWLTQHGHVLNLTAFGEACGLSKFMLSRHCTGKVVLNDASAAAVAEQLEAIGVKLLRK